MAEIQSVLDVVVGRHAAKHKHSFGSSKWRTSQEQVLPKIDAYETERKS